jgi:hypothetical protein
MIAFAWHNFPAAAFQPPCSRLLVEWGAAEFRRTSVRIWGAKSAFQGVRENIVCEINAL